MEIIILLATVIAIVEIKRHSVSDAILKVLLPALLIAPGLYTLHLPHLPFLGFADAAMIPIIIGMAAKYGREWKLQRADLWLALFVGGVYYSELGQTGSANAGLVLFGCLTTAVGPYMVGKLVAEQDGMRDRLVRRFVLLMFIVGVFSVTEFRLGTNLFTSIFGLFFPGQRPWLMQLRGGFVRVAGPYGTAELAGMIFLVALPLSLWLASMDRSRNTERKYFGIRRSTIITAGIVAGLLMTQSRGPWLGAALAFLVSRIGRATNIRRTAIVTILICAVGGTIGYVKAQQYTAGSIWDAQTPEQANAIYRRELLENYKPIVDKAGLFGYGVVDWPRVPGQSSIDNEFLFLEITQGKLGLWTYLLLSAEALIATFWAARKAVQQTDRYFAFCIAGAILGLMLTLTTVYMGAQSYPLFFLLIGWSQSLRQTQSALVPAAEVAPARLRFRRVFA